ncbi:Ribosome-binding factor A [Thalassoglobus neptunius]|uniref:Ribosome-binding factor A n=1 Tax=Thalassoglobus neptunius TaxID=1938619 RepID=A0A5C5X6P8_9PLAN|nr:30S ribosome-binding factor RbfA [Thalassoglobus neptunius]TWT58600.1 Ribosome-binding factor A [Thalassoglobus neptunius]
MKSRRTAKVAEAIRQVVSSAILIELRDPRVKNVTVLNVDVAGDLRTAKVYVSILGDEKTELLSLKGLNAARGWLQSRIADQLQLRLTPVLTFLVDGGVKKSIEVSRRLHELGFSDEDEASSFESTDDPEELDDEAHSSQTDENDQTPEI